LALWLEIRHLALLQALVCSREAIPELRFREAVVERCARRWLYVCGEGTGARRLTALNQGERQRHQRREQGKPSPSAGNAVMFPPFQRSA
jgi:hypothetical protein